MIDIGRDLQLAFDDGYKARDDEIVRCKDCVYHRKCMLQHFVESNAVDSTKIDWSEWYCADGVRSEKWQSKK